MTCNQAKSRCHRVYDDGAPDPALDQHVADCAECRSYDTQMRRLRNVLGRLRGETETLTPSVAHTADPPAVHGTYRLRRPLTLAASIVLLILVGRFLPTSKTVKNPTAPRHEIAATADDPRLGLSLRGESATNLLAVAAPPTDHNVQVYFLYPRLDPVATRGQPETMIP